MRILVADDDRASRRLVEHLLGESGHEVEVADDGLAAWAALQRPDGPRLGVLDWVMPGLDGPEVCRRAREELRDASPYLILLTARESALDTVTGLRSGADDYVCKPFDSEELCARVQVGCRVLDLQRSLAERVRELEAALAQVRQLRGLLPICCYCKKIRDDQNYWQQVEKYLGDHSEVRFSHGICPDCWALHVEPQMKELGQPKPPA
jgi:phosphoserine phosphatase RsbU/P